MESFLVVQLRQSTSRGNTIAATMATHNHLQEEGASVSLNHDATERNQDTIKETAQTIRETGSLSTDEKLISEHHRLHI